MCSVCEGSIDTLDVGKGRWLRYPTNEGAPLLPTAVANRVCYHHRLVFHTLRLLYIYVVCRDSPLYGKYAHELWQEHDRGL